MYGCLRLQGVERIVLPILWLRNRKENTAYIDLIKDPNTSAGQSNQPKQSKMRIASVLNLLYPTIKLCSGVNHYE